MIFTEKKNICRFGRRCYLYYRQILESWLRLTIHNNIVNNFIKSPNDIKGSYIIPLNLLEEQKPFILIKIPFCDRGENKSNRFIWKIQKFTNNLKYQWNGLKRDKGLSIKGQKCIFHSCKIYQGNCIYKDALHEKLYFIFPNVLKR